MGHAVTSDRLVCGCQETQSGDRRSGVGSAKPSIDIDAADRERALDRGVEGRHSASSRTVVGDHQQSRHVPNDPTAIAPDPTAQTRLPVERRKHRLEVWDDRLDLHDHETTGPRMEGQDVDRTALATDVERHLGHRLPARLGQARDRGVHEPGVCHVEKAIERLAVPAEANLDAGSEGTGDGLDRPDREPVRPPQLDPRDAGSRHASRQGEIALTPTASSPKRPKTASETDRFHRHQGWPTALIRGSPSRLWSAVRAAGW